MARETTRNEHENGEGLQQAADHVAGEHGGPRNGHGAESVDDAPGHVGGDGDRGAEGGGCHRDDQDAGDDVGEVGAAVTGAVSAEAGAELATEDVDEQQQEHDREASQHQRQRRVAQLVSEVTAQHCRRIGEGAGEGRHGWSTFSSWPAGSAVAWPVTASFFPLVLETSSGRRR